MTRSGGITRQQFKAAWAVWPGIVMALASLVAMVMVGENHYQQIRPNSMEVRLGAESSFDFISDQKVRSNVEQHIPGSPYQYELAKLPLADLEEQIENHPHVKSAEVFANIPGQLSIHIRQRTPVVRIINQEQESFYLDEQGQRMPFAPAYGKPLITATGQIHANVHDTLNPHQNRQLQAIYKVSKHIRSDSFLQALTGQLYVDQDQNIQIIPRIGEQTIVLGKARNLTDRFAKLRAFYREVLPREGWYTYKRINLKYQKQIVAKK